MIRLNRTTIWKGFPQYISITKYKIMALKVWSFKCFKQYIIKCWNEWLDKGRVINKGTGTLASMGNWLFTWRFCGLKYFYLHMLITSHNCNTTHHYTMGLIGFTILVLLWTTDFSPYVWSWRPVRPRTCNCYIMAHVVKFDTDAEPDLCIASVYRPGFIAMLLCVIFSVCR